MIKSLMTAVFGTRFDRERKKLQPVVDQIHAAEKQLEALYHTSTVPYGPDEPPTWMKAGDTVEVEVERIGVLTNPVVDET